MLRRSCRATLEIVYLAVAFFSVSGIVLAAEDHPPTDGDKPPTRGSRHDRPAKPLEGPSVVKGEKPGIEVGEYAPDFELQPVEPYAILQKWLGDDAPKTIEQGVKLSQLVGKAPIMLMFGSYT